MSSVESGAARRRPRRWKLCRVSSARNHCSYVCSPVQTLFSQKFYARVTLHQFSERKQSMSADFDRELTADLIANGLLANDNHIKNNHYTNNKHKPAEGKVVEKQTEAQATATGGGGGKKANKKAAGAAISVPEGEGDGEKKAEEAEGEGDASGEAAEAPAEEGAAAEGEAEEEKAAEETSAGWNLGSISIPPMIAYMFLAFIAYQITDNPETAQYILGGCGIITLYELFALRNEEGYDEVLRASFTYAISLCMTFGVLYAPVITLAQLVVTAVCLFVIDQYEASEDEAKITIPKVIGVIGAYMFTLLVERAFWFIPHEYIFALFVFTIAMIDKREYDNSHKVIFWLAYGGFCYCVYEHEEIALVLITILGVRAVAKMMSSDNYVIQKYDEVSQVVRLPDVSVQPVEIFNGIKESMAEMIRAKKEGDSGEGEEEAAEEPAEGEAAEEAPAEEPAEEEPAAAEQTEEECPEEEAPQEGGPAEETEEPAAEGEPAGDEEATAEEAGEDGGDRTIDRIDQMELQLEAKLARLKRLELEVEGRLTKIVKMEKLTRISSLEAECAAKLSRIVNMEKEIEHRSRSNSRCQSVGKDLADELIVDDSAEISALSREITSSFAAAASNLDDFDLKLSESPARSGKHTPSTVKDESAGSQAGQPTPPNTEVLEEEIAEEQIEPIKTVNVIEGEEDAEVVPEESEEPPPEEAEAGEPAAEPEEAVAEPDSAGVAEVHDEEQLEEHGTQADEITEVEESMTEHEIDEVEVVVNEQMTVSEHEALVEANEDLLPTVHEEDEESAAD